MLKRFWLQLCSAPAKLLFGQSYQPYYLQYVILDVSRFDAAPLIAFIAPKETSYGNETDGRIPR